MMSITDPVILENRLGSFFFFNFRFCISGIILKSEVAAIKVHEGIGRYDDQVVIYSNR